MTEIPERQDCAFREKHNNDVLTTVISGLEDVYGLPMEELPRVGDAVNIDAVLDLVTGTDGDSTKAIFDYQDSTIIVTGTTVEIHR
jgi:hypothetical protein